MIKEIRNNEITTLSAFATVKDQIIQNNKKNFKFINKNNANDQNNDFYKSDDDQENEKDDLLVEPGSKNILNKILDGL